MPLTAKKIKVIERGKSGRNSSKQEAVCPRWKALRSIKKQEIGLVSDLLMEQFTVAGAVLEFHQLPKQFAKKL